MSAKQMQIDVAAVIPRAAFYMTMRKLVMLWLMGLVLAAALLCPNVEAAGMIDDFERADPGIPSSAAATISLVDAEAPAAGKALSIAWTFPHKAFIEANYAKPIPVSLTAGETAAIRFDVWTPASPSIGSIAIRLLDSRNQVFQWLLKLPDSPTAGWRAVLFPLDKAQLAGNWGGPNDGRLVYPAKFLGLTLNFANSGVPADHVLIDNLRVDPISSLTLETDRFPFLVNTESNSKCDLVISNPLTHPIDLTIKGKLTAFSGSASEVSASVNVPASGQSRLALPITDRQRGIRWLDTTVRFDTTEFNYIASFVIADPVQRSGGKESFRFGICSHTEKSPEDEQELEFQAAAAAGANEMRTNDAWAHIQRKPGESRWETQDRLVDLATKYGIEVQMTLGFTPSWAISDALRAEQAAAFKERKPDAWKISVFGPPEEGPWRAFVNEVVTRYRGKIRNYEIWNEPDLGFWRGTTDDYIQRLRWASEEIRRADPEAKVMSGGFATVMWHAGRAKNPDLQERVLTEASDAFDIHAIHQHGPFPEFKGAVENELRHMRSKMPHPRPLYFNETALSSAFGGEKFQATTLVKKMSYVMGINAFGYTWYDLRNDGTTSGDGEQNYGLLTADFRPKAAFAAYAEFVRQMQGMRPVSEIDLGTDREGLVFSGPRGRVIVWWTEGRNTSGVPVLLRSGPVPLRAIDIMGNETELPQVDGIVCAQPSNDPQYIVMPAGEGAAVEGLLVKVDGPKLALAGQPMNLTASLTNPWPYPINIDLAWTDASGKPMTASVTVPAKGTAQQAISAKEASSRQTAYGMDVSYSVANLKISGKIRFSSPVVRKIENTPPDNRVADWTLDKRSDYLSFTDADPSLTAHYWRGPEDLSAKVWVWRQDDAIRVRVDVRDDMHAQKEKAQDCARGDSLQLAFQCVSDMRVNWEIGVAQADDGSLLRAVWASPAGTANPEAQFNAACEPIPGGLRYEVTLSRHALGLTDAALRDGLRFNLCVNDNDGSLRKGLVRLSPGLGEPKSNPQLFPVLYLEQQDR